MPKPGFPFMANDGELPDAERFAGGGDLGEMQWSVRQGFEHTVPKLVVVLPPVNDNLVESFSLVDCGEAEPVAGVADWRQTSIRQFQGYRRELQCRHLSNGADSVQLHAPIPDLMQTKRPDRPSFVPLDVKCLLHATCLCGQLERTLICHLDPSRGPRKA